MIHKVLTIAGSDSSGGAGIQADIKAISASGSYACSVITALTAQNTQGVTHIHPIPSDFVTHQLDAIFHDLTISAVKIGMLNDRHVIQAVADKLQEYQPQYIVIDPVMIATSGSKLLEDTAISALQTLLFPLATVITPNLMEAATLTQQPIPQTEDDIQALIHQLQQRFSQPILLKGGHSPNTTTSTDWLITTDRITSYSSPRIQTKNTHGTGCTLSAALASYLAQGDDLSMATQSAKRYLTQALQHADNLDVGHQSGPVDHFFQLRSYNHIKE